MKRKEIIQALKDSKTCPDFWTDEMWEVAKEIGGDKFEVRSNGDWEPSGGAWIGDRFQYDSTYRLRPDYTETSIEDCEAYKGESGLLVFDYENDYEWVLSTAINFPQFRGYKFSDGTILHGKAWKKVNGKSVHATHVLMEVKK